MKHTFVICAYKESAFLEECILSLKKQTVRSNILIATSTPNKYIDDIAEKYGIVVMVNKGQGGITQDCEGVWGFDTEVETRVTDETLRRIRRKLSLAGSNVSIGTIWGFGYRISIAEDKK